MNKVYKKTSRHKTRSCKQNELEDAFIKESSKANHCTSHQQMEKQQKEDRLLYQQELWQLLSGIYDMSRGLPQRQFRIYRSKIQKLNQLFAEPSYAGASFEDDLPTSSDCVEKEIGKYIAECLSSAHEQSHDTGDIQDLIRDYKVVQPLPERNHSVSLQRVHSILEDNFPNSSLYQLLELLVNGKQNIKPKVITLF